MKDSTMKTNKEKKPQGPIRWNAIIPFSIFTLLIVAYFHFFFDLHLKKLLEWGGYKALGVEVNIGELKTSFFNASFQLQKLEITDSEKPQQNSLEIGDIRYQVLWDALLRAKFAVNEVAVEGISFGTKRSHPGKVAPPEPPKTGPGFSDQLKDSFLEEAQNQHQNNVFGDLAALLQGESSQDQLKKLEGQLPSKAMAEALDAKVKERKKYWDEKFKTLPQGKELQNFNDRLSKVKTRDFKSPQELQASLQEVDSIIKDMDSKYKTVSSATQEFSTDLNSLQEDAKKLDAQVKQDVETLKQHFKIPKLDAKTLGKAVFMKYLSPYIAKFNRYKSMAEKYMPPKFKQSKEDKDAAQAEAIVPHERDHGTTYEFGRLNAYPLFWVKRVSISSQAGKTPESGDIKGEILNISSNQTTTGRPTTFKIEGNFPGMNIFGFKTLGSFDNTKEKPIVDMTAQVDSYEVTGKELLKGDVEIGFEKATGRAEMKANLIGFKQVDLSLNNAFTKVSYNIKAKSTELQEVLKNVFFGIPKVTLTASGKGDLPNINFDVATNIGSELQAGFEKQINAKIEEAKAKVQKIIDEEVGKHKAAIENEIAKIKSQFGGEIQKSQNQLEGQKKQADQKIEQAKKDAENQAKGQLQKEGQKALDDLKKKLGF